MFKFFDFIISFFQSLFNLISIILSIIFHILGTLFSGVTMLFAFLFTLPTWLSGGLISIFFIVVAFTLINIVRGS